jgi:hypothetical protein
MTRNLRTLLAATTTGALALALAGGTTASARTHKHVARGVTLRGVVVHRNARAHSFTLAGARGQLLAVHARRSPRVGRSVVVRARRLRNGTYAATAVRVGKLRRHARIRGTVTYVNRSGRSFVVSARGVSLLVHAGHVRLRAVAAASDLPSVGDDVTVNATVDDQGDVEAGQVSDDGDAQSATVDLEGTVLAIDPTARTLTISADDDRQTGATLTVLIPASFDISAFNVGDEVELTATLNPDGTYTAVSSACDDNAQQANDGSNEQGSGSPGGDHGDQQSSGDDQQSDTGVGDTSGDSTDSSTGSDSGDSPTATSD